MIPFSEPGFICYTCPYNSNSIQLFWFLESSLAKEQHGIKVPQSHVAQVSLLPHQANKATAPSGHCPFTKERPKSGQNDDHFGSEGIWCLKTPKKSPVEILDFDTPLSFGKPGVPAPGRSHLDPSKSNSIKISSSLNPSAPHSTTLPYLAAHSLTFSMPGKLYTMGPQATSWSFILSKLKKNHVAPCPWPDSSGPGFPQRSVVSRTPVGAHSSAPGFKRRILLMRSDLPTSNLQQPQIARGNELCTILRAPNPRIAHHRHIPQVQHGTWHNSPTVQDEFYIILSHSYLCQVFFLMHEAKSLREKWYIDDGWSYLGARMIGDDAVAYTQTNQTMNWLL